MVLPEAAMRSFTALEDVRDHAEQLDGPFVRALIEASRQERISILAGVWEWNAGSLHVHNTIVAIAADRGIFGTYRKIHLFDALEVRESDRITAGDGGTLVFDMEGLRFGVMTCYDLRFPELARHLVDQGADVLVVPAAWRHGPLKEDHWITLCKARALENTSWLVGSAQVGAGYSGHSLVVDPLGVVVHAMGDDAGLLFGELSRERVETVRARLPVLKNRRFSVRLDG